MDKHETIEFAKSVIENIFNSQLDIKEYGYLLKEFKLNDSYQYFIDSKEFHWEQISEIIERQDWWTYYVFLKLTFRGTVRIQDSSIIIDTKDKKFNLYIDLWFKTDRIQFVKNIMDENYKVIKNYIQQIEELNQEKGIPNILDNNKKFNNKNFLAFATEITRKPRSITVSINDFEILDDIIRIMQDLQYLTGEILHLGTYIGNYTSNPQVFEGKTYYNYSPSYIDKRYFFSIGIMFEILYNFWDRIGDLLAVYFTPSLNPNRIYFGTVIGNITSPYDTSSNYIWLKNFKDIQYSLLNNERKQVVHYKNIESKYQELYGSKFNNKTELDKRQSEKIELMKFVRKQYQYTFDGVEKALLLIDEIT